MDNDPDKISCRTPTPGKQATRIPRWKFELLRKHLLALIPVEMPGVPARQVPALMKTRLGPKELERLGSLNWHLTTVKLEMEVRGEIERIPRVSPQRLIRKI